MYLLQVQVAVDAMGQLRRLGKQEESCTTERDAIGDDFQKG